MALFPPQPSDNIKIQNGQLNPSSISDLIVMVLPPVPGRPLPPRQPSLYDTKWPGYNFSIFSKNSVNNSFGMSRRHSLGCLRPGLSPLCSQGSQYTEKDAGLNRKCKRLINLPEFTIPFPAHSNRQSHRDKNVIFTTWHGEKHSAMHSCRAQAKACPTTFPSPRPTLQVQPFISHDGFM